VKTKADSPIRSMTTRHASKRVSKAALFRAKVATIALSMVLFVASLTGIAIFNPGVGNQEAVPVQAEQIIIVKPGGLDLRVLAPRPSVTAVRPLTRSRGS